MKVFRFICILISVLTLARCGASSSKLQITNGYLDLGDKPVVLIRSWKLPEVNSASCTASFIKADILITGAHCVKDPTTGIIFKLFIYGSNPLKMVDYRIHPLYANDNRYDIALIKLESKMPTSGVLTFSEHLPKMNDSVHLIGFGGNEYIKEDKHHVLGSGIKRTGQSTISKIDDFFIYSQGILTAKLQENSTPTGIQSALVPGDSGGPLLDESGALIGIASRVILKSKLSEVVSQHVRIDVMMDFIQKSLVELAD